MRIDPSSLSRRDAYALMTSVIVPRPIAWVSTLAGDGTPNLAPFSFFMGIASQPPTLALAIGSRRGAPKDTSRNIARSGEFVVNVVNQELAELMVATSGDYPPEIDEFAECGLTPAPSELVGAPRVQESPVAMECRLQQVVEIGDPPTALVIGEVLRYHIDDELWTGREVDASALRPIGRLGGLLYAPVDRLVEIPRPQVDPMTGRLQEPTRRRPASD